MPPAAILSLIFLILAEAVSKVGVFGEARKIIFLFEFSNFFNEITIPISIFSCKIKIIQQHITQVFRAKKSIERLFPFTDFLYPLMKLFLFTESPLERELPCRSDLEILKNVTSFLSQEIE